MSRFVTAGGDEVKSSTDPAREDAWAKAQAAIEASRAKPKTQDGKQEGGKSLYEVLQANKAQKEQAFEEASKLKNQFRALDDDELDFLDSVQENERQKEAAARKETVEEIQAFRKQQQEAERKAALSAKETETNTQPAVDTTWQTKKRRRKEAEIIPAKIRKTSTADRPVEQPAEVLAKKPAPESPHAEGVTDTSTAKATSPTIAASSGLGLGAYDDSDED